MSFLLSWSSLDQALYKDKSLFSLYFFLESKFQFECPNLSDLWWGVCYIGGGIKKKVNKQRKSEIEEASCRRGQADEVAFL